MRQKLITLCPNTWDLAAKKTNFSEWVRNQLRSERNKMALGTKWCYACDTTQRTNHENCTNKKCKEYMTVILEDLD